MVDIVEVTKASGEKVFRRSGGGREEYASREEAEDPGKVIISKRSSRDIRKEASVIRGMLSKGQTDITKQEVQRRAGTSRSSSRYVSKPEPVSETLGVYDVEGKQSRLATPIESAIVSKRLSESQMSFLPGKEPEKRDVKVLLKDPKTKKIYFKSTKEGAEPVLVMERTPKPKPLYRKADDSEGVGVEGFFKPGSEDFLDISDFFSNVRRKGKEIYKRTLDPQFEISYSGQLKRTLVGTGMLVGGGAIAFGGGVASGFTMPFRHPVETLKGFKELAFHPVKSVGEMGESFVEDPFGTAGEFYGFGKAMKVVKKTSPVKFEYEAFGKGGLKTAGVTFGYEAFGRKAFPIVTYKSGLIGEFLKSEGKGAKLVKSDSLVGEGFVQPGTLVGTKVFKSRIGDIITEPTEMLVEGKIVSPELQRKFTKLGIESEYELRNVESKFFTTEQLYKEGTKGLTPKETKALGKMIGRQKGKLFGSGAFVPQLEPSLRRVIGDIEGRFDIKSEFKLADITKQNLLALQRVSPKSVFRIIPEEPFHIEKRIKGKYEKVAEFKGEGIGEGDVAPAHAFGFDLWSSKDFMKVDKINVAMLRGELKRKTAGSIMVKEKTSLGVAHEGRFKDVVDLFKITESLAKSKVGRTPKAEAFLKTAKEIGVDYKTPGDIKFEILEKKLSRVRSPSLPKLDFSPRVFSPSVKSPRLVSPGFSPSVVSPKFSPVSPSVVSPSLRSPKSPSLRSPVSPSIFSPSVVSPKIPIPSYMVPKPGRSRLFGFKPIKSEPGLAYIPDFTAKVLGLRIKPRSKAQLKKLLKQQSTGLELARFGVVI